MKRKKKVFTIDGDCLCKEKTCTNMEEAKKKYRAKLMKYIWDNLGFV